MTISIVIATVGDPAWGELAWSRAYPSAIDQGALEVLVDHYDDGSVSDARNALASRADGDWLCFLDADDELCPSYITEMETALNDCDAAADWLLAPAVCYLRPGKPIGIPGIPNAGRWPDLNTCVIGTLVPHLLFEEVGGFRDLTSLEDYDLWLRCVKAGAQIVHVPHAVYCAHVNTQGGRNADQSIYPRLREEHAAVWDAL